MSKKCICGTNLEIMQGIGEYCPNKECSIFDGPFDRSPTKVIGRVPTAEEQLTALIKVINDSVKDTAFPHKLYEALIDGDTRKMKPIGEIMELAKGIQGDSYE